VFADLLLHQQAAAGTERSVRQCFLFFFFAMRASSMNGARDVGEQALAGWSVQTDGRSGLIIIETKKRFSFSFSSTSARQLLSNQPAPQLHASP
jgi:hypothetical protein